MSRLRTALWLSTLAVSTVHSGCAPTARDVRPPVDIPATFSAEGQAPLPERWWRALGDDTLNTLIEEALEGNPGIWAAWARLDQAAAIARRTGANLMPSLSAQAEAARVFGSEPGQEDSGLLLGLAATYELDVWGRIRASRDAGLLDAAATEAQLRAVAISLSAEVALTWYLLVEAHGQLALLDAQIETSRQVLELVSLRFQQGQVGAVEVLRQGQAVEALRGERVRVLALAEVLAQQLAILRGRPPTTTAIADGRASFSPLPPLPATGLPAELIQRRPDVRSAMYAVQAADRRVAAAVAERFPRLSLSASAGTSAPDARDLFQNWFANLLANVVAPLFDGGLRAAEVDRARAAAAEALHTYGGVVLTAFGEVEAALVREQRQQELLQSLRTQLELSETALARARGGFAGGTTDYLTVLDVLRTHQQLERSLLTARREQVERRIELYRALAGGWDMQRPAAVSGRASP